MSGRPLAEHSNALGFLRLVLASLVIVAHTPELVDGNRGREILSSIFGSTSFGGLAVDGFFVVSGFLITGSFLSTGNSWSYLKKRIIRIYPGFLAAYLLCVLVVTPLGGGAVPHGVSEIARVIVEAIFLQPPRTGEVFSGSAYPVLNGAMWTIAYEFRCYIAVMLLGLCGVLRSRRTMLVLAVGLTVLTLLMPQHPYRPFPMGYVPPETVDWLRAQELLIGSPRKLVGLLQVFLVGSCFYLYRDKLRFSVAGVVTSLLLLSVVMLIPRLADIGISVFFGYFLIGFATFNKSNILARINNKEDVSYGLYLAGWPIEKLLIWWLPGLPLIALGIATLALSFIYGFASWRLVERPLIRLGKTRRVTNIAIAEDVMPANDKDIVG